MSVLQRLDEVFWEPELCLVGCQGFQGNNPLLEPTNKVKGAGDDDEEEEDEGED